MKTVAMRVVRVAVADPSLGQPASVEHRSEAHILLTVEVLPTSLVGQVRVIGEFAVRDQ